MLDLILKLIDGCVTLVTKTQERNRTFFEEFVAPVIHDFESLHQHYVEAMIKYKHILEKDPAKFDSAHPVFKEILANRTVSSDLRAKIETLDSRANDKVLGRFIEELLIYLMVPLKGPKSIDTSGMVVISNRSPHLWLHQELSHIVKYSKDPRKKSTYALPRIEFAIKQRQIGYAEVMREYRKLEDRLLRNL